MFKYTLLLLLVSHIVYGSNNKPEQCISTEHPSLLIKVSKACDGSTIVKIDVPEGENQNVVIDQLSNNKMYVVTSDCHDDIPAEDNYGYKYYKHFGFYKEHHPANWSSAKTICESEGGHLSVINSENEAKLILRIHNDFDKSSPVIHYDQIIVGALKQNDNFVTIFGETLASAGYEKWAPKEPSSGEFCVSMFTTGELNAFHCHYTSYFICEKHIK